jgi:hypothetical protein
MLKKILTGLVIILAVAGAGVYFFLNSQGFFTKIYVSEKILGPVTFVYTSYQGDYTKVGAPMKAFCAKVQKEYKLSSSKGYAIYYSDPKTTKTADLKSDLGFLLEGKDALKMPAIMKKYHVRWIGPKKYVTATFPIKNDASYMIGALKVYPELGKYMTAKGYKMSPAFEMYDVPAKLITYGFEVKK